MIMFWAEGLSEEPEPAAVVELEEPDRKGTHSQTKKRPTWRKQADALQYAN